MKFNADSSVDPELIDLIRVNQLIRNGIDFDGFKQWHDALTVPEQCTLISLLIEFAYQGWWDEHTYPEVISEARVDRNHPVVRAAASAETLVNYTLEEGYRRGQDWLMHLSAAERFMAFSLFVYLFGKAEGKRYEDEPVDRCNHWWHRDLLDDRVVQALLNDPDYSKTSRRDDLPLKMGAA